MKEVTLQVPDGKKVEWREVNGVTVPVLVDEQQQDNRPVTERIKTFEDALADLNKRAENGDKTAVELVDDWNGLVTDSTDLIAYHKIRIIAYALNEGWEPQFVKGEYRWCPWFDLYTQQEIDNMDEEEKSRVLGRSVNNANASAGVAFSDTDYASSSSLPGSGGRLCFKSEALAEYAGTQFLKEFADLMMFTK